MDQPLVEGQPSPSEPFKRMTKRIEDDPSNFGGACVIVPPGGHDPIEFLMIDPKGDVAVFLGTIKTKLEMMLADLHEKQRGLQGWGR
jgi:hypothetical protein